MGGRPNPNQGHRFAVLDGWRGIAALCVALYHFPVYSHIEFSGFVRGAYLFVDFFFVLSGFVIAYVYADRLQRWDDVTEFIVPRFGRLWPLHVATLLFLFAMELAKLYAANRGWLNFSRPPFDPAGFNNWASIPTNLVLIQALGLHGGLSWNGPAWSICTEFWTYLVFAALCWSGRRSLTLGAAACVAGGLLIVVFAGKGMNVSYDYGFFRCIFGFFTGYFAFCLWRRISPQMRHWMGRCEIPAVGAVILFSSMPTTTSCLCSRPSCSDRWSWSSPANGGSSRAPCIRVRSRKLAPGRIRSI